MNRIYRLVWNGIRKTWSPAAETCRSRRKGIRNGEQKASTTACRRPAVVLWAALAGLFVAPSSQATDLVWKGNCNISSPPSCILNYNAGDSWNPPWPAAPPGPDDRVIFDGSTNAQPLISNNGSVLDEVVDSVIFREASSSIDYAAITGSTLSVSSQILVESSITADQQISAPLTIGTNTFNAFSLTNNSSSRLSLSDTTVNTETDVTVGGLGEIEVYGQLNFSDDSSSLTVDGNLILSGGLAGGLNPLTIKSGAQLIVNNNSTHSVSILENSGGLWLADGVLQTNSNSWSHSTATISGAGGLSVNANTLTLESYNSYSGTTTVNSGATLKLIGDSTINNSSLVWNDGTLDFTSANGQGVYSGVELKSLGGSGSVLLGDQNLVISYGNGSTYSGNLSGTGGLYLQQGSQRLSGVSSYTGRTEIQGSSTLYLNGVGGISQSSEVDIDGTLNISGLIFPLAHIKALTGSGNVVLGSNNLVLTGLGSSDFDGVISGSGMLYVTGGTHRLDGTNTYSGGTRLGSAELGISNSSALGTGSMTIDGGFLRTYRSVDLNNNISLDTGGGTVNSNVTAPTLSGNISGSGALSLDNTGIIFTYFVEPSEYNRGSIRLSGNNSYSGGTDINNKLTVIFDNNNSFGTGAIELSASGAQLMAGTDNLTLANDLVLNADTSGIEKNIFHTGWSSCPTFVCIENGSSTTAVYDTTLSGVITGNGGLEVTGEGTLTLAGDTSFTGNTEVGSSATLKLTGDGDLDHSANVVVNGTLDASGSSGVSTWFETLTGSGQVNMGSQYLYLTDGSGTFSGSISGTGGLNKYGSATYTLSGNNSYTGETYVSQGILRATTSSLPGDVRTDATFELYQDSAGTLAGNIRGNGELVKSGTGVITLTGTNTYSGGTTVSGGTLKGNTTSLQGNIANNANVTFAQSTNGSYAGDMSGTGSLIKSGSGTVTLTGTNSYSGGTTVSGGALQGDSSSLQGNIHNYTSVIFNQDSDGTYTGDMDGSGSFTKSGNGTLFLTGSNTYTGTTTVSAGILRVNGSTTSSMTINSGAALGGSGAVGSVTINSGGILSPGNSIGTLKVSGDVDFSGGGTYQVEVDDAGNSDMIIASGNANLSGGAVTIIPESGNYNYATDYTILNAGSITGTFDSVSSSLAFLEPSLSYDTTNVYLRLTRNDVSFGSVGNTKNQHSVGDALSDIASGNLSGDMQTLLNSVTPLSTNGARQAYDSLSGVQHADAQSLLLGNNRRFSGQLNARANLLTANPGAIANQQATPPVRLAYNGDLSDLQLASNGSTAGLMETQGSGFWLTPQGGIGNIDDTANASGASYSWYGLYGGVDKWLDNQRLVGFALGASHTNADPSSGDISLDSMELAFYGRWVDDKRYVDASLSGGVHSTDTVRHVTVGTLYRAASANYDAQSLGLSVEAGQTIYEQGEHGITPFVGLRYARLSRDGFEETGAGSANLSVDSASQESLQGRLGVRTEQLAKSDRGRRLDWDVSVAWAHEFKDTTSTLNAGFEGAPSTTFSVDGPELDRNRVQLVVGLTTNIGKTTTLRVGYDTELTASDQSHTASAKFQTKW